MVFDFAIWSRNEPQRPILLVCEEAHRYIPSGADAEKSSVGRILSRIAKEGRKYGVSLGLITQRPSDLAEGVLRSEEHTSELQSLMRISYAVFCLKKKTNKQRFQHTDYKLQTHTTLKT